MNPRTIALHEIVDRKLPEAGFREPRASEFGQLTFDRGTMERLLPKKVLTNVLLAMEGKEKINPLHAEPIAQAMKEWAVSLGATHFCHWFQPLTGLTAFKHDGFVDWDSTGALIESFTGKQLMSGEPDGSSFPSGGMRQTHGARGYTTWDPSSPPFLWKSDGATVMCVPALFFSWGKGALDMKIPLLRSDDKVRQAALRLLSLLGIEAQNVYSTLGCEQEYFLVDLGLAQLRPDLIMVGRTVCGAPSPKSQELADHYFGAIKERIFAFMKEFEAEAIALGIPLKTRHCEVAPQQFEVAPIYEKMGLGVDHNILLMEVMKKVAVRHQLYCLFHEKPFAGVNGSGKHNNWSLATDTGLNLLDPTSQPEKSLLFLSMVTAVLGALHEHGALLRASIASAGNDHRLGGHEAPPPILSVYLGEAMERLLDHVEQGLPYEGIERELYDLGISALPALPLDHSDRNRTSPFAFTGNKFEFRAVGSSANCALPMTVLNSIVAQSLHRMVDEMEKKLAKGRGALEEAVLAVVRTHLKASRAIRFTGDNYSHEWVEEAKRRHLPILANSVEAFKVFQDPKAAEVFHGVFTQEELRARFYVMNELYAKIQNVEAKLLVECFRTQILPVVMQQQKSWAKSLLLLKQVVGTEPNAQMRSLQRLSEQIELAISRIEVLEEARAQAEQCEGPDAAAAFCSQVKPRQEEAREAVDDLERLVDDREWTLPKYRELLMLC